MAVYWCHNYEECRVLFWEGYPFYLGVVFSSGRGIHFICGGWYLLIVSISFGGTMLLGGVSISYGGSLNYCWRGGPFLGGSLLWGVHFCLGV